MPIKELDPHRLGMDEDWEGNNAAFRCPICGKVVARQTSNAIVDQVTSLPAGARLMILAPVVADKKGAFD